MIAQLECFIEKRKGPASAEFNRYVFVPFVLKCTQQLTAVNHSMKQLQLAVNNTAMHVNYLKCATLLEIDDVF